jgi:hypothetical protein
LFSFADRCEFADCSKATKQIKARVMSRRVTGDRIAPSAAEGHQVKGRCPYAAPRPPLVRRSAFALEDAARPRRARPAARLVPETEPILGRPSASAAQRRNSVSAWSSGSIGLQAGPVHDAEADAPPVRDHPA